MVCSFPWQRSQKKKQKKKSILTVVTWRLWRLDSKVFIIEEPCERWKPDRRVVAIGKCFLKSWRKATSTLHCTAAFIGLSETCWMYEAVNVFTASVKYDRESENRHRAANVVQDSRWGVCLSSIHLKCYGEWKVADHSLDGFSVSPCEVLGFFFSSQAVCRSFFFFPSGI